jgi:bifunctional polynucleotide phosphatase/kinase
LIVQALLEDGFKVVIFTNQALIGTAHNSSQAIQFRAKVDSILTTAGLHATVFVATVKDGNRKPSLGMWQMFQESNAGIAVDVQASFYCGDAAGRDSDHSADDLHFAINSGLPFKLPEDVFGPAEV